MFTEETGRWKNELASARITLHSSQECGFELGCAWPFFAVAQYSLSLPLKHTPLWFHPWIFDHKLPKKRVFPIYPLITPKLGFFYDRWSIRHPWFWQYLWLYSHFCRPKYTLLEYHKLCSKIQDNSKFWIWIFKIKSHDLRIFKGKNYLNLNFRAINRDWRSKTKISIIENNWILTNSKSNRKNHNISLVFGTKIQIYNFIIFSENWFFRQNLKFSNSVPIMPMYKDRQD